MIFNFKKFIIEDAEFIIDRDTAETICDYRDTDARAFGYYKGEMIVGVDKYQWHCYLTSEDNKHISRWDLKYPGRMWLEHKIITFWTYPPKEELMKVLNDIKESHDNIRYKIVEYFTDRNLEKIYNDDDEIDWDDSWKIEILRDAPNYWENDNIKNIPELIPLKDYVGSIQRSKIDMGKAHIDWRLKDELKKKGWGKGWGSDLTAWDGKNPLWWRQAKYQENKMYDLAQDLLKRVPGGRKYFDKIDAALKLPKNLDIIQSVFKQIQEEQGSHFNLILTGGFGDWVMSLIRKGVLSVPGNLVITNGSIGGKDNRLGKITTDKEVDIVHKKHDIENQKFILFDDSFYSGSTKKALEDYLKKYGSEIYKTYVLYDGSDESDPKRTALYRYYDYHSGTKLGVDMLIDYLYSLDIDIPKESIRDMILNRKVQTITDVRNEVNKILIKFGKQSMEKLPHRDLSKIIKSFESFEIESYFIENKTVEL